MNVLLHGNALLALAAAALWGGGDFSGGMAVKRAGGSVHAALRVVLLSHALSFVVLLSVAHIRGDAFPQGAALAWGLAAGVAGGISLTCFYIALSRGAMGAASAVSGLMAAAIPAALTLWIEGSPGPGRIAGFALAGIAIWLIAAGQSQTRSQTPEAHGTIALAVIAGAGFGLYFVALKMAGAAGVVWPMATARIGSLSVCSLILGTLWLRTHTGHASHPKYGPGTASPPQPVNMNRAVVLWTVSTAVLDTSGNLIFIAATRAGRLDVAAVLASLYPASTILLAAALLGERPTRRQALGMGVAAAAVLLIGA